MFSAITRAVERIGFYYVLIGGTFFGIMVMALPLMIADLRAEHRVGAQMADNCSSMDTANNPAQRIGAAALVEFHARESKTLKLDEAYRACVDRAVELLAQSRK